MPPDMIWSDNLHKSETKLSIRSVEWKNLMNECLMATQLKRTECCSDRLLNPNIVMNIRHQMVKKYFKKPPTPHYESQKEAKKLIREENSRKLLKIKEENLIKKELGKLHQFWEYHDTLTKKCLKNEEKQKHVQQLPNITPKVLKLWVQKINRQNQMENIKQVKILEKTAGVTIKMDAKPKTITRLENEKGGLCFRTFDDSPYENPTRFLEKVETVEKEISKVEVKPSLPLEDLLNRKRMKRAWKIWRAYIHRQKIKQKEKKIYNDKIEEFLRKLQQPEKETKANLRITTCKQEPKIFKLPQRAQTAINDKERLEKLHKLMREVNKSQTEVLQKLRTRSESSVKAFSNPRFLSQMEERHEERQKRWQKFQERKQRLKEERENMQKREQEEKQKNIEREKQKKAEEMREKRRAEKEKKEEQRKKREKLKRDLILANSHYQKLLLTSYGLRPWIQLMKLSEAQHKQAIEFYNRRLLMLLHKWKTRTEEQVEKKTRLAEQLFNRALLKRCWDSWMELRIKRMSMTQVAVDWNDFKITEKVFGKWMRFTEEEQLDYLNKKEIAEYHFKRKLKIKYFQKLCSYPEYKKQEQETELRKLKWRQKVKEIIPDYQPVEITQDW